MIKQVSGVLRPNMLFSILVCLHYSLFRVQKRVCENVDENSESRFCSGKMLDDKSHEKVQTWRIFERI